MIYQVKEADLKITDQAFEEIKKFEPTGADDFSLSLTLGERPIADRPSYSTQKEFWCTD
jgi:hypothetical protein